MNDDRRQYANPAGIAAIPTVTSSTPPPVPGTRPQTPAQEGHQGKPTGPAGSPYNGAPILANLFLPEERNDSAAHRAVLVSWAQANNLPISDMPAGYPITMTRDTITYTRRMQIGNRPNAWTAVVWTSPLLVAPAGIITSAASFTCGHISTEPSPVADAAPLVYVCDQYIDPFTRDHPGRHAGYPGDRATANTGTGYHLSWPNEHPGKQAFYRGIPDATGMAPDAAHTLVLARLALSSHYFGPHCAGLLQLAERHQPEPAAAHPDRPTECKTCEDYHGPVLFPCPDYRDALTGIVHFPATP